MDTPQSGPPTKSTDQPVDPLIKRLDDFAAFAESFVAIKGRDGLEAPFVLNPVQVWLDSEVERIAEECQTPTAKVLILKSRGTGCTTWAQARMLWKAWANPGHRCLTMAHTKEKTTEIFNDMVLYQYERMPDEIRPSRKSASSRELLLPGLDSKITIATAEGKGPGRGSNLHEFHGSEVAYWPVRDEKTLIAGITEAVRIGYVGMESTANGCSGWFYDQCMSAMADSRRHPWKMLFVPAFSDPQNRLKLLPGEHIVPGVPGEFDTINDVDGEKEVLEYCAREYGTVIPPEYFKWRRHKKRELGVLFPQEYPETPMEAFLSSGSCRFQIRGLNMGRMSCEPALFTAMMQGGEHLAWAHAIENYTYIIGVDTSEGVPGGDNGAITVHDAISFKQVARWHGLAEPRILGLIAAALGKRYNNAMIAVERNNHGHSVLNTLVNEKLYTNLYIGVDGKLGWCTNPATRDPMIDDLASYVDGCAAAGVIHDPVFWGECQTFERQKTGKYEAAEGKYDDMLVAIAIALQAKQTGTHTADEEWYPPEDDADSGWSPFE